MASQKQARAASGRSSSAATTGGSGSSTRRNSRSGGQTGRDQNSQPRDGNSQGRNAQAGSGRGQGGSGRGQGGSVRGQGGSGRSQAAGSGARQGRTTATQARPSPAMVSPAASQKPVPSRRIPLWFQLTTLVLSLAGLGVSIYLTIAHYTSSSILACSDKGVVNCAKVTTSPESIVFGIFPVAVLGLAFYVFMVAINTPWAWRYARPWMTWLRTAGGIAGIGFVLYLIYAEIIEIGNICLWCTSVHVITFLLFVLLMSVAPFTRQSRTAGAG
jgi:uncharacterized membrane protein